MDEHNADHEQQIDAESEIDPSELSHPRIRLMEQMVAAHGEVHAVLDEHDSFESGTELEVRQGTAEFNYDYETIVVDGADTTHFVPMDAVVRYYLPREVSH